MKVKTILVSQPEPKSGTSPYHELGRNHKVNVDFRSFIHLEPVEASDVRQQKVSFTDHTAVILTSRHAADHYFRICQEMRFEVPTDMKYFCLSESTAFYLQKYVVYRKRKIFHGQVRMPELIPIIKKHKKEKFLLPCSDLLKPSIPAALDEVCIDDNKAVMY